VVHFYVVDAETGVPKPFPAGENLPELFEKVK
jgi:hypothetical protein